jgi:excisionase family DNA binding protein
MFDSPQVPTPVEPLLDSEHAAALILIHPKTLQRYARKGLIPGVRVGKLWRFRASDIYSHFSIVGAEPIDEPA